MSLGITIHRSIQSVIGRLNFMHTQRAGMQRAAQACAGVVEPLEPRQLLAAAPATAFAAEGLPLSIADEQSFQSTITVPTMSGRVTDAGVAVRLAHEDLSQVQLALLAPSGVRVRLVQAGTLSGSGSIDLTLDDQAQATLGSSSRQGLFQPAQPLALVLGEVPAGPWKLEVTDMAAGQTGTLEAWTLQLVGTGQSAARIASFAKDIADAGLTTSTQTFTNASGEIVDVNLRLSINHPNVSDLRLYLLSPGGARILLLNHVGGDGDNFINTRLDDAGWTDIDAGASPFTGIYRPAEPLNALLGTSANGVWTLEVHDDVAGNAGSLTNWSLSFTLAGGIGEVSGMLWNDYNGDGLSAGEGPMPGRQVYADFNGNGRLDAAEPSATTDAEGRYRLYGVRTGESVLRLVDDGAHVSTFPADGARTVTLGFGAFLDGQDFGAASPASISGMVFDDRNGNGLRNKLDPGVAGATVYLDLNGDGIAGADEPRAITDAAGGYAFTGLRPGTYAVRHLVPKGYLAGRPLNGTHPVTLLGGESAVGLGFGDRRITPRGEIDILGIRNNSRKPSAEAGTLFGSVRVDGGRQRHRFVLRNTARLSLLLITQPTLKISGHSGDFRIVGMPPSTIKARGSVPFTIEFNPTAPGVRKATLVIASSDPNKRICRFVVQGTGVAARTQAKAAERLSASPAHAAAPAPKAAPFQAQRRIEDLLVADQPLW